MPWASDSPTTWRTTSHCVQPSALSVPSSRTRLPTDERVRSTASRNAATAARIASAMPSRFERFDGVDERAADRVGDLLRARDLRVRVERLDLLLHVADRGAARRRGRARRWRALLAREHLELGERDVDVGRLAAERRPDEADDGEVGPVEVELRADLQACSGLA